MKLDHLVEERYSKAKGLVIKVDSQKDHCLVFFENGLKDIVSRDYFRKYFSYVEADYGDSEDQGLR